MAESGKNWLVSRHTATVAWIRQSGLVVDQVVEHLDPAQIAAGDTVIGTLPLHLAAQVCERGACYRHLSMDMPFEWRGKELSVAQVEACNPRLEVFRITRERADAEEK